MYRDFAKKIRLATYDSTASAKEMYAQIIAVDKEIIPSKPSTRNKLVQISKTLADATQR